MFHNLAISSFTLASDWDTARRALCPGREGKKPTHHIRSENYLQSGTVLYLRPSSCQLFFYSFLPLWPKSHPGECSHESDRALVLCNVVLVGALIPEQENPLNAYKAWWPSCALSAQHPSFRSFIFLIPDSYALALISHPAPPLFSFWTRIFSSCHRGKQNTVAVETARREERGEERGKLMRHPEWRQKPIYGHFLSAAGRPGSTLLWTLRLSFLCDPRDRWNDRQTEWDGERKTYGVWSAWYRSLGLAAAAVLLLLACPAFCAPPPQQHTAHTLFLALHPLLFFAPAMTHSAKKHSDKPFASWLWPPLLQKSCKGDTQQPNTDWRMNVNWTGCPWLTLKAERHLWGIQQRNGDFIPQWEKEGRQL